jgi:ring-1,2-phenylacetyl-CoA epoxidase subunit PaaC
VITTSIRVAETPLVRFLLARADDALILGHRLSEWTGHAPILEEELALANIALDLIGQARALYDLAAVAEGAGHTQDDFAYLRNVEDFRNLLLVELPRGDFAFTIARQFLYAAAQQHWLASAMQSSHAGLAAIAAKAEKENAYHLRHSAEWLIRLGDGTAESHRRAQDALDTLWPYTGEMFAPEEASLAGIAPSPDRTAWRAIVAPILARATLVQPKDGWMQSGGRLGRHSEHLGHLLAELQHIARSHPGATW